jgi:hypothetical protein
MNKRGQIGISVIIAITIFIIGLTSINFLRPEIDRVRLSSGLDCDNSSGISDGTKLTCLAVDLVVPYFFLIIISVAGGLIIGRFF